MSELGKPPKIARPTAKTVAGLARPAGAAQAKPASRQAPASNGLKRPGAALNGGAPPVSTPNGAARPVVGARPADPPGSAPARMLRPKPDSPAGPSGSNPREKNLVGLGNFLKTKREIHGLTRRDVVVKIKIPLDQLEAIEDGRLSSLPPVFAKGFLRAYANELGLDAETILEDYRQMTGGFKNEPATRKPLSSRYVESSVGTGRTSGLKVLLFTLGAFVALAALLFFLPGLRYTLGGVVPFLDQLPGFAAATVSSAPSVPPGDSSFVGDTLTPTSSSPSPENSSFVEDSTVRSGNDSLVGVLTPPASSTAPPQGGTLSLSSREDKVWVQVVVDGEYREHLILNSGQKAAWAPKRQIIVTTGQANALSVNWNGQDLGLLSNESVAEVTFPKS